MSANKHEEEVDLGSLFVLIGKGFTKFFNFIGGIFVGIFHFLILILLFFKKNFLKLGIAMVIGAGLGLIIDVKEDKKYGSNLLVQTNFDSARQLYNNVEFYNNLVKQENIPLLVKTFNINEEEAKSLQKFIIEPVENSNDIVTTYDELILSIDTLTAKSFTFLDFKKSFTKYDYKVHNLEVKATKNDVFTKLDEVIISSITENSYFNKLKELTNENLNRTDKLLRKNLSQTDSLHNLYKKVLLEEAKSVSQGTNIDLGSSKQNNKELDLFSTSLKLNKELKEVSVEKSEKSEVVNVISNFQPIGYEIKGVSKYKFVQIALLALGIMILYLLGVMLNRYLNKYKK
ncbi:conserved hypothetical protein [Tenacibaculum sp. 190524A02b]|uniref:Lipopolysaccharide biosynthesis protein n=1 Tax=Tenacibaculum vairaonense TaxID=3137860 RepID=A0ABP1FBM7_9FLAO